AEPGHVAHPHAAVRRHAHRRRHHRGRAHLHPGARAGTNRRAPAPDALTRGNRAHVDASQGSFPVRSRDRAWRARRLAPQARPARTGPQPRHFRRARGGGRHPVMFVVLVGSVLPTALFVQALLARGEAPAWFIFAVSLWLWFTVLFANFAEAMAEGRGKAQAESLKRARRDLTAKKLAESPHRGFDPASARYVSTTSALLR